MVYPKVSFGLVRATVVCRAKKVLLCVWVKVNIFAAQTVLVQSRVFQSKGELTVKIRFKSPETHFTTVKPANVIIYQGKFDPY